MLDLNLRNFIDALASLNVAQTRAHSLGRPTDLVPNEEMARINDFLSRIVYDCRNFQMPMSLYRISRLVTIMRGNCFYSQMDSELGELFSAVEADARDEYFAHYDKIKSRHIRTSDDQWAGIFECFPSSKHEIVSGLDCFGLGHNEACVFHMARAAEIGLRIIGQSLGVLALKGGTPIEWATWGQVLKEVDDRVGAIRHRQNGPQKDEALQFYNLVLGDLRAIQSLYRDPTMHLRDDYSDGEADGAIFRVHSLLAMLATRLDERAAGPIDWGFSAGS